MWSTARQFGSVANVTAIAGGAIESGFSQADVATWAQTGTAVYEGKPKVADLIWREAATWRRGGRLAGVAG